MNRDKIGTISKEQFDNLSKEDLWNVMANLVAQNHQLQEEIALLKECKRLANADKYKPSSEQMGLLFNEIELMEQFCAEEFELQHVKAHEKKVRKKKTPTSVPSTTPVYEIHHESKMGNEFIKEGVTYKRIEDCIIDKLAVIPAQVVIERHFYPQFAAVDVEEAKIVQMDNESIDGSFASPSLIANMLVSKFDDMLPLYRQEEYWRRHGITISRQNMARWAIRYYEALLPLEALLQKAVYTSNLVMKDETSVQVLNLQNDEGKPSTNCFMHITISSSLDQKERRLHEVVLFQFKPGRSINYLLEELRRFSFSGYLMTDGLKGYQHFNEEHHATCWVHAVRAFKEVLKADTKNPCLQAQTICNAAAKLYIIEETLRAEYADALIDEEEFLTKRKEQCLPIIDNIFQYATSIKDDFHSGSKMGKGIAYLFTYRENLYRYLDVFECSPSNNKCEQSAKAFAVGRKNFLFCQSVDGADTAAFFYSLIETAKRSGLNPYDYLEHVCTFGPYCQSEEEWEALLPWNVDLSLLEKRRALRMNAKRDEKRVAPYKLTGFSR